MLWSLDPEKMKLCPDTTKAKADGHVLLETTRLFLVSKNHYFPKENAYTNNLKEYLVEIVRVISFFRSSCGMKLRDN